MCMTNLSKINTFVISFSGTHVSNDCAFYSCYDIIIEFQAALAALDKSSYPSKCLSVSPSVRALAPKYFLLSA